MAGKPLVKTSAQLHLKRIRDDGTTVHGFRSTFRDWAGDRTAFERDLIEAALAHSLDKTEAAYRRGDALEKRRKLMEAWSAFCEGKAQPSATVTELRRA